MDQISTKLDDINKKLEQLLQNHSLAGGEWLTVDEAAKILRISRGHCYELVKQQALPAVHVGRTVRISAAALRSLGGGVGGV